jgi:hypothetical protein
MAAVGIAVVVVSAVFVSAAWAEGGKSIATSASAVFGQQEFGNTAEGQHLENSCGFGTSAYRSYWNVTPTAGDLMTISWEGTPGTELKLLPVGTTDFTLFQVNPVISQEESSNGKNQATYSAPVSGSMPLYFRVCGYSGDQPGPYSFLVTDQHAIVTTIRPYTHLKTTATVYASAALAGGTPVPDGTSFTLNVSWADNHVVQYAASTIAGGLAFPLALPEEAEGEDVTLAITRPADGTFQAVESAGVTAKVAKPRATCVVPRLKSGALRASKRKLRAAHCMLGKVSRRKGAKARSGRVVKQTPKPGMVLPAGSSVNVTIGRG